MLIREFVGGMELVSGRSMSTADELTLLAPTLPRRTMPGFSGLWDASGACAKYPWPVWCGLGETDLLAASVAAMKDGERWSGPGFPPGDSR